MKVVLDSNIFVSSFYWAGNPRQVFERITNGFDELYITGDNDLLILQEYRTIKIANPKNYLDTVQEKYST